MTTNVLPNIRGAQRVRCEDPCLGTSIDPFPCVRDRLNGAIFEPEMFGEFPGGPSVREEEMEMLAGMVRRNEFACCGATSPIFRFVDFVREATLLAVTFPVRVAGDRTVWACHGSISIVSVTFAPNGRARSLLVKSRIVTHGPGPSVPR